MVKMDIKITSSRGPTLDAVHYTKDQYEPSERSPQLKEKRKDIPFVILCHGFTGDKYEWGRFPRTAERLLEAGMESVLFDFGGSGKNEREPITLSKQVSDLESVFKWALEMGYTSIGTIGLSFGGLTSLLAELPDRKCAVFWAPAFNMKKAIGKARLTASKILFKIRAKPIKVDSLNNEPLLIDWSFFSEILDLDVIPYLKNFKTPALIVQGKDDVTVDPADTRKFFSYMPQDGHHKLVEVEKATHDFAGEQLEEFIDHSIEWLKKYL